MWNRVPWVVAGGWAAVALACSDGESASSQPDDPASTADGAVTPAGAPDSSAGNGPSERQPGASSDESLPERLPLAPADAPGTPPLASPASAEPQSDAPIQERLPELPSVRQEHAVVALEGELYVIGGFTPNVTPTIEVFDPGGATWRRAADFPFALHHANAAAIDGKLIVAGFYVGTSFTLVNGRVLEYDPALDAWSERGLMPGGSERASSCVAALGSKMYLFGGARLGGSVAEASAYDAASGTWEELPPLPEPREHCVAAEIEGVLYIAAGRSSGIAGFEPNTWAFDPVARTYAARAPIATPRGGVAGAVLDGRLFVFGGEGSQEHPSGVFDDIEAYDPASDSWEALAPMLAPRHGLAAAALNGRIYLPGGATTQGFGAAGDHTVISF